MSDGKEVKRKECVTHHHSCDCREAMHAATIAELRAEVERTKGFKTALEDAVIKYRETIARQARVIEIAKRVFHNAGLRQPDGGTPTVETICEDLNDAIKKIAAIERAEGEKE